MTQLYFTAILVFVVIMTAGTAYAVVLHNQNEDLRREIVTVEAERDAARRSITAMAAERAALDARNRAAVSGKTAIDSVSEGATTKASQNHAEKHEGGERDWGCPVKALLILALALMISGCATTSLVPDYLLNCEPQPIARTDASTTERQVGHYIVDLAVAGDDCRTKLGSVREILSTQ